jgi:glycosyltransferase involved in cell wall biosynthesis
MQRLKVFVLGTRGIPHVLGGIERHCEQLYPRLVQKGCDVHLFTRTPYISKKNRIQEWKGVKLIHLWCPRKKSFEAIIHTFLGVILARFHSPDILHIHAIGPALLVPLARLLGIKVVITNHGKDYNRQKWGWFARLILKLGERVSCKYANKVIVVSSDIMDSIKEKYNRSDCVLTPTAVNPPVPVPSGDTLKKYKLKANKYIFSAARFVPEKGLHDLIEAYRKAKIIGLEAPLVITGDADHETSYSINIKKIAEKNSDIILTGFISRKSLEELLSNAGLYVLPSYHEGMSMALLEALSYHLPVLVSDIPPNLEVGLDTARYFKVGDVDELAGKLHELIIKGISDEEIGFIDNLISTTHNWDIVTDKTFDTYKKLA